jgi:hypothetical protein
MVLKAADAAAANSERTERENARLRARLEAGALTRPLFSST